MALDQPIQRGHRRRPLGSHDLGGFRHGQGSLGKSPSREKRPDRWNRHSVDTARLRFECASLRCVGIGGADGDRTRDLVNAITEASEVSDRSGRRLE